MVKTSGLPARSLTGSPVIYIDLRARQDHICRRWSFASNAL